PDANGQQPYGDMVRSLKASADTMQTLTGSVLDVVTLGACRPCWLSAAVEQVRELHRASLQGRYTSLEYDGDTHSVIDLPFDVLLLTLSTLVENAIEAKPAHGSISIVPRDAGTHVECRVHNDGPAIPEGIWEEIFEPGFTTKKGSRGFGLYLIRRVLRENGGDIMVETSNHQGTMFLLRFPKPRNERA
ncbi:MAG: ATP-binding protein, partial [Proteobacteria bacterium]|nr:ATP-binding protein [Pseudomonadota bacterium]